jgi:hypothetical protein
MPSGARRYSTWPTPGYVPIGLAVGPVSGIGSDTVRVERVHYVRGQICARRAAYGVPEGNLAATILPDGTSRTSGIYEHHMGEYFVKYKVLFIDFPDVKARDKIVWLNVAGTGIEKPLIVNTLVYDISKDPVWIAHCEEHVA